MLGRYYRDVSQNASSPRPGYWARRQRYPYYARALAMGRRWCAAPSTVLDVGPSDCEYAFSFLPDAKVTLIDLAPTFEAVPAGARFIHGDFTQVQIPPHDLVFCLQVLEHVPDPSASAQRLLTAARGALIVSVPLELVHPIPAMRRAPIDRSVLRAWFGRSRQDEEVVRGEVYRGVRWDRIVQVYAGPAPRVAPTR